MNWKTSLTFLLAVLLLFNCKKKDDITDSEETGRAMFEVYTLLNKTYDQFLDNAATTNGNPWEAIMLTDDWIRAQAGVATTEVDDSIYIHIEMTSGLQTMFHFNEIDQDGFSAYRGGGSSGGRLTNLQSSSEGCSNTIENTKVLIYAAAYSEFYKQAEMQRILDLFANADQEYEVSLLKDAQCTPEVFETFKDYGLVIMDTHGAGISFMTGTKFTVTPTPPPDSSQFKAYIIQKIGSANYDKLLTGKCKLGVTAKYDFFISNIDWYNSPIHSIENREYELWITTEYIKASPDLPNTVVFGNMCYSGITKTGYSKLVMGTAFINKNPISYYAYALNDLKSSPVHNNFSKRMEDSLVNSLINDKDSTGIAHLSSNGNEFGESVVAGRILYLKHFKSPTWCYGGCEDAGTFTDPRDGQTYKYECIGGKTWMVENLRYNAPGSKCYDDSPGNCSSYGRLYQPLQMLNGDDPVPPGGQAVQGICPEGWHLPTREEVNKLITAIGGNQINTDTTGVLGISEKVGIKLKSALTWNDDPPSLTDPLRNSSEFNGLAQGYFNTALGTYRGIGNGGAFWTSSFINNDPAQIFTFGLNSFEEAGFSSYGISLGAVLGPVNDAPYFGCRCVKD